MAEITVQNFDGTILAAVDTALAGATLNGVTVFKSVTVSTSEAQAREAQFKGATPRIIILYNGTEDAVGIDGERCCTMSLELLIASKADPAIDESARITEIMRLMNLAKNAIEESPPADAKGFGDEDQSHRPGPVWGDLDITPTEEAKAPWIACALSVTFGYGLTASTRH